jgi:hypothetical protein
MANPFSPFFTKDMGMTSLKIKKYYYDGYNGKWK